ncbi:MAG: diguanylate cyclase [Armatimonadota bacterium]
MAERTTVMIAAADQVSRRIMAHLLERNGYEVLVARDGREALELTGPDVQVALIDWMMPGAGGVEVCRRLNAATGGRCHVIMVSARSERAEIVQALNECADDYMTMPIDHAELLARVRAAERVASRERRLAEAWMQARDEADRDALTGLHSRRVFDQSLAQLTAAPRTREVALLMIDLDRFKRINDAHGHRVGDEVLREVAAAIRSVACEAMDSVARYGGEEIAVIRPGAARAEAEELGERIRRRVARLRLAVAGTVITVTVSVGVAVLEPDVAVDDPAGALVAEADARLYDAKRGGRNRVAA